RYMHRRDQRPWLRQRLRELAEQHPRHGYWRLYRKLRRAGVVVNHKCVHRLYREEGLRVEKRRRKRVARARVDLPLTDSRDVRPVPKARPRQGGLLGYIRIMDRPGSLPPRTSYETRG